MISYLLKTLNYFFPKQTVDDEDDAKEDFLASQLVELEVEEVQNDYEQELPNAPKSIPRNAECFQRTGVITYMNEDHVLIDGMLYFDTTNCSVRMDVNDKVLYLCYKDYNDSIVVVRILENQGLVWGDEIEEVEEDSYRVIEHVIVSEVGDRKDRLVLMKDSDLKFSLDNTEGSFVPVKGDWLELKCSIQFNEDKPADISAAQVLQVVSFKPLRRKVKNAIVTDWFGESGICDRVIYFDKLALEAGLAPKVGAKILVEAIESIQGTCSWRALKLIVTDSGPQLLMNSTQNNEDDITLKIERDKNIDFTYPIKFENVDIQETAKLTISITNKSTDIYMMNKWMVLSKKRDSQIEIKPFLTHPMKLQPNQTFIFTVTCYPKFLGNSKECLIVMFKGFQLKRFVEINVINSNAPNQKENINNTLYKTTQDRMSKMRNIRKADSTFVPGVRMIKPPAFVPVKIGAFTIPEKVWAAVLGDSEQIVCSPDFDKILDRIETAFHYLSRELCLENYADRLHTLLYMEEVQASISMRAYDTPKAFLIRCQEYLAIEINGLSERRPSLMKGDRVIAKDIWDTNSSQYEGFIHNIKGDLVLLKFNPHFHDTYSGSDVSLEFHFNRTSYRKLHQAVGLALQNLGSDILFPKRILSHSPQVPTENIKAIQWYNEKLNNGQKAAVQNILAGECRPLPYCIFGPPGTGKTVTVIETILQILNNLPDSRILVATPSNSAANVITERLLENRNSFSDSVIRLIANYLLDSDNIPDIIKPYCATLDIAREQTSKSKHTVKDGMNLNCQAPFIGRHRVTIGTCMCLGSLAQMGLPKGHFTHVIVDEAGQATEPEIMIPLTFIDKENGQIILAGDPMQLGPVVISKYCLQYGFDESFLERLLDTFPYQKDFAAYQHGFNPKLVTKLNDNYRSIQEVITLPSQMFYDASLVPQIDRNEQWIVNTIKVINEILDTPEQITGGIYVYGIQGVNARAEDSPSWYNAQEASMVALTVCKLFKKNITVDDIGIITPYIAQVKYLRLLFDGMGLPQPKIGTVEEFQGQERHIILISTVRSTESLIDEDQKYTLGFVKNPKRLNVALTRAQVGVILFCNPHVLSIDPLWARVIEYAVKEDKYIGCDLPSVYNSINNNTGN